MKEKIKENILELSHKKPRTFHELVTLLEKAGLPARGDQSIYLEKPKMLWTNISQALRDAMLELMQESRLDPKIFE